VTAAKKQPVVVTTEHRGVFFGFANGDTEGSVVKLTDAQMCVYWSTDVHGVLGLAATGPSKNCRVTPRVPKITLQAVTAVVDASDAAVEAWQARPWS